METIQKKIRIGDLIIRDKYSIAYVLKVTERFVDSVWIINKFIPNNRSSKFSFTIEYINESILHSHIKIIHRK